MMASSEGFVLPGEFVYGGDIIATTMMTTPDALDKIPAVEMSAGDVLLATYPRAGTTWMQEILFLVTHNADIQTAKGTPLEDRFRFLEINAPPRGCQLDQLALDPHPWLVKTHLPARMFSGILQSGKVKVVVVMRNPKDNLTSLFHFYRNTAHFKFSGDWDLFFEMFKSRRLLYGDMFAWNLDWWAARSNPNVLVVTYEDMKRDVCAVIRQVARHCGRNLSADDVMKILQHTSFQAMKENPMVMPNAKLKINSFLRKGEIGDWEGHFTDVQNAYIDERIRTQYEIAGLHFQYCTETDLVQDGL